MNRRLHLAAAFLVSATLLLGALALVAELRSFRCRTFVDPFGGRNVECRVLRRTP